MEPRAGVVGAVTASSPCCCGSSSAAMLHAHRVLAVAGLLRMRLPADLSLHRAGFAVDRLLGPRRSVSGNDTEQQDERYPHGLCPLECDDVSSNRHHALSSCLSMIFSENRYPLFGIML